MLSAPAATEEAAGVVSSVARAAYTAAPFAPSGAAAAVRREARVCTAHCDSHDPSTRYSNSGDESAVRRRIAASSG